MAEHSVIGASTCERWWNCPGSVSLVKTIPPQPPSPYAEEGTAAHEMAATCLLQDKDAMELVGEFASNGYLFTEEMAEAVQDYLDAIRTDMDKYQMSVKDILVEHKFHLKQIDSQAFGTNDCCLPVPLIKLIVYDYKHGQGVMVNVEENKQLMFYALGAADLGDFDEVELVIIQPRAPTPPERYKAVTISVKKLQEFAAELKNRIHATRENNAPRVCGEWCKKTFCPAMAVCPEFRKMIEQTAMIAFDKPINLPKPEAIKPELLKKLLDSIPLLDAWTKAVWSFAEQKANAGETVLGYKLVKGREGNRKWADETEAQEVLKKLSNNIYKERELLSPSQLEKRLGKNNKETIDKLCTRAEGKTILVPESDSRPAVTADVTKVFSEPDELE